MQLYLVFPGSMSQIFHIVCKSLNSLCKSLPRGGPVKRRAHTISMLIALQLISAICQFLVMYLSVYTVQLLGTGVP